MFLATAAAGALLNIPNIALGDASDEQFFATVDQPIGVAASPGKLLVTRPFTTNPRQVVAISTTGAVTVFSSLPALDLNGPAGTGREEYIAISPVSADYPNRAAVVDPLLPNRKFPPNEAGFAAGFVYVTQGANIVKIAPDGSVRTPDNQPFAQLPSCGVTHTGITFDRVGNYGYRLIATCTNGNVYAVDSTGTQVSRIGTVPPPPAQDLYEGPDVVPSAGFGALNGQLLFTAENAGKVLTMTPNGSTSTVAANIGGAEGAAVIPSTVCSFGDSGAAYFSAIFTPPTHIAKIPKSAFTGQNGALVRTEFNGNLLMSLPSGTTTQFGSAPGQHEGASFCVDSVPTDITGFIRREPGDPINPNSNGVITVFFFPIPGVFDPFTVTDFRAGFKGTENSFKDCNTNPVAGGARLCHFFTNKLGLPGPGVYRGLLRFNVIYKGKEGGSDAGGCA